MLIPILGKGKIVEIKTIKHTCNIGHPVWSPVGNKIVFHDYVYNLYTVDVDDGTPVKLVDHGEAPVWSPDGEYIYYQYPSGDELKKVNVHTLESETIYKSSDIVHFSLSWSGEYIAVSHEDRLLIINNDGSSEKCMIDRSKQYSFGYGYGEVISWSSDNNWITCAISKNRNYQLIAVNITTGKEKVIYMNGAHPASNPVNNRIAFSYNDGNNYSNHIFLGDFYSEEVNRIELKDGLRVSERPNGNFSWSPDGKLVAFVKEEKKKRNRKRHNSLWVLSVTDEKLFPILDFNDGVVQANSSTPTWSPDSKYVSLSLSPDFLIHIADLEKDSV